MNEHYKQLVICYLSRITASTFFCKIKYYLRSGIILYESSLFEFVDTKLKVIIKILKIELIIEYVIFHIFATTTNCLLTKKDKDFNEKFI